MATGDNKLITETREISAKTIERIVSLGLIPHPPIYELWFRYFQGDKNVIHAIDSHAGVLDEDACMRLHRKLLSEVVMEEAVKKVGDQMSASIDELARVVNTAQSAATVYGETLEKASDELKKVKTVEQFTVAMSSIVQDTKKMVEKNQEMEVQLVNSSNQVTELRKNLDIAKKEVFTDGLTGLYNRKGFDTAISEQILESDRAESPLSLLMLDIDFFKSFNDNFGHQVGDQVLRLVARTLTDNIKGRDISARYGGEEFSIILPDTPLQNAIGLAESLRRTVESKEIVNKTNNKVLDRITLSIGAAQYTKGEGMSSLISRADAALYEAKHSGRNKVVAAKVKPSDDNV